MACALSLVISLGIMSLATTAKLEERRCSPNRPIGHVAVVGGTHGNERMGLIIVDELLRSPPECSFDLTPLVANAEAVSAVGTGAGRRYMDMDLNRCFLLTDLTAEGVPEASEARRAREIDALLGPKSSASPKCDLVLDLHSTTANTGVLLCLHPRDGFAMQLAAHLRALDPSIRVALWPDDDDVSLLPTVGRSGLTVEVGACAHSTIKFELLVRMRAVVFAALAYVDLHNACVGDAPNSPGELRSGTLPVHSRAHSLDYPRAHGHPSAFIHPDLQGVLELDTPLAPTAMIFARLDGSAIDLASAAPEMVDGDELFPMFVNEAAYYEKNVALVLVRRKLEPVSYWTRTAGA
jgi:succinylglutamate desuccinylase